MSKSTSDTSQHVGNTLDYYNDDMSRKAVGRLFDGLDVQELRDGSSADVADEPSIVKGYDRAPDDAPPEPPKPRVSDAAKPSERSGSPYTDIDYDLSLYRKKKAADDIDDDIYPSKPRRRPQQTTSNPEPAVFKHTPAPPPARPKARPAIPDYVVGERTPGEPVSGDQLSREYSRQTTVRRERDEQARASYTRKAALNLRPYVLSVFFVLIVVLAVMVMRMNSLNTRLIEAEKVQAELNKDLERYTSIQLTNEDLEKQVTDLEELLAAAEAKLTATPTPSPEQQPSPTPQTSAVTLPTVYTVKSGDNLSKISKQFYGSPNQFQKIIDANALSSETINVGMTLTIPK